MVLPGSTERISQPSKQTLALFPSPARTLDEFPSLVVEIGVDETLEELRANKNWWFDHTPPEDGVNIVLLVKQFKNCLLVERWNRDDILPSGVASVVRRRCTPGSSGGYAEVHWAVAHAVTFL